MTRIALIGLGAMGSRMADRWLDAGHEVTVHNRTRSRATPLLQRGAHWAPSPREAGAQAEVVLSMVRDDGAARSVWLDPERGALAGMQPGALAVECSTLSPSLVRQLARESAAAGFAFVEAPVVGSRPQADAGELVHLCGGRDSDVQRLRPLLGPTGRAVHHVGPAGCGAAMKLAVNALFAAQLAALGECLATLRAHDIPVTQAAEVLAALPVTSPAARAAAGAMATANHEPMFPVALVVKDLGYMAELIAASGLTAHALDGSRRAFELAAERGLGGRNITAVTELNG